jgi:hypothetical protein
MEKEPFDGRIAIAMAYPPSYLETHTKDDEFEVRGEVLWT